jgi:hypothetical protein
VIRLLIAIALAVLLLAVEPPGYAWGDEPVGVLVTATWYGDEFNGKLRADGTIYSTADPTRIAAPLYNVTLSEWGWSGPFSAVFPGGQWIVPFVTYNSYQPRWPLGARLILTGPSGIRRAVRVADTCGGCGPHHVDLPPSLFVLFAPLGQGVVQIDVEEAP